jgi:hypothetical protein
MTVIPLYFQDFDFAYTAAPWCWGDGRVGQKWVPYGMPRFRPSVAMTTFYLYRTDERTGEITGPCGTGFCVAMPSTIGGKYHLYAITAHHVIASGASHLRFNRIMRVQDGTKLTTIVGTKLLTVEPHEWQFIPGGDDIAGLDITAQDDDDDLIRAVHIDDLATIGFIDKSQLTLGEDVFMVGLFTGNPGSQFNHVAVRFGNLSQLSNGAAPIKQGNGIVRPSHVIDMHSRPGFSGSPVFVYRTPGNDLTAIDREGNFVEDMMKPYSAFVKLLGVHSGQFVERMTAEHAESLYDADPIKRGDKLAVQSSMTIVVPAWSILELLGLQHFVEIRKVRDHKVRQQGEPTVQPEVSEVAPATDNPSHKEDFTRLLGAAAKANKPAS